MSLKSLFLSNFASTSTAFHLHSYKLTIYSSCVLHKLTDYHNFHLTSSNKKKQTSLKVVPTISFWSASFPNVFEEVSLCINLIFHISTELQTIICLQKRTLKKNNHIPEIIYQLHVTNLKRKTLFNKCLYRRPSLIPLFHNIHLFVGHRLCIFVGKIN